MSDSSNWVYRLPDEDGALLYVGFTTSIDARFEAHHRLKPWWTEVASITLQRYATRGTGMVAERTAILQENPRYNKARYPTVDGKTPQRSFRLDAGLHATAQARAAERGETLSDVVRRAFEAYLL